MISYYAGDTTFIFDGYSDSLYITLMTISGFKLNYLKSKVIWKDKEKYSKDDYHHSRWKLEWGLTRFTLSDIYLSKSRRYD